MPGGALGRPAGDLEKTMERHHSLTALLLGLFCFLGLQAPLAADTSADPVDAARVARLLRDPEQSEEYAAFIADLTIQIMVEERQKNMLFVPPETYAANSSPQSSFGRLLVAEYRRNWNESVDELVGMLTRRGWLAAALSPRGARVPMSLEADNKVMPLIGYITPLLYQRDLSDCDVERGQPARCYATVALGRDRQGNYSLNKMTISDAAGKVIQLPHAPASREKAEENEAPGPATEPDKPE